MIAEAFLTCALALPASNFTRPPVVSWQAIKSEEDTLKEWLKKRGDIDDVFITPEGQTDVLREHGWERAPFRYKDKEVWIHRKPRSDQRLVEISA